MRVSDLGAALLRVYAAALSGCGYGEAAGPLLSRARQLEQRPPSAAQLEAFRAAGFITHTGDVTPEGRAALADVLGGEHESA